MKCRPLHLQYQRIVERGNAKEELMIAKAIFMNSGHISNMYMYDIQCTSTCNNTMHLLQSPCSAINPNVQYAFHKEPLNLQYGQRMKQIPSLAPISTVPDLQSPLLALLQCKSCELYCVMFLKSINLQDYIFI